MADAQMRNPERVIDRDAVAAASSSRPTTLPSRPMSTTTNAASPSAINGTDRSSGATFDENDHGIQNKNPEGLWN